MAIDSFTIHVAVLALPGLIGASIQNANRHSSTNKELSFLIRVFAWTLFSYAVAYLAYTLLGIHSDISPDPDAPNPLGRTVDEISSASIIALIGALAAVFVSSHRYVPRLLNWSSISTFTGCDDIWEYVLDEATSVSRWVQIRDYENLLIYSGYVKSFSDSPSVREIWMLNVQVFGLTTADLLYEVPGIYLSMLIDKCIVEFQEEQENG